MRKILAALLAAMMLLTMVAIPTFAATGDTTFTVSTVEKTFAGYEVEVTVDVTNNAGMAGVVLVVDYNKDALVWDKEAVVNGSVFTATPTVGTDKDNIVWAQATNTTTNGKLVTLKFKVADNAVAGEYPITVTVGQCSALGAQGNVAVPTNTVAGKIVVATPVAEIADWNIALDESVTVNYYANVDAPYAGAQMQFSMNGYDLDPVDGTLVGDQYVYSFNGVAPHRMGDDITANLVLDGKVLDTKTASVADYCANVLGKTAADLGISDKKFAALETLVANLLEYGATAQVYNNYKTNALVSEIDLSDWVEITEDDVLNNLYFFYDPSTVEGAEFISATMKFADTNSLVIRFTLTDAVAAKYYKIIATNDLTGEQVFYCANTRKPAENNPISNFTPVDADAHTYEIVIDNIFASTYNGTYTFQIQTSANGLSGWSDAQFMMYSVTGYVYAMQNSTNTNMANLAKALYNYGAAAEAYANA